MKKLVKNQRGLRAAKKLTELGKIGENEHAGKSWKNGLDKEDRQKQIGLRWIENKQTLLWRLMKKWTRLERTAKKQTGSEATKDSDIGKKRKTDTVW